MNIRRIAIGASLTFTGLIAAVITSAPPAAAVAQPTFDQQSAYARAEVEAQTARDIEANISYGGSHFTHDQAKAAMIEAITDRALACGQSSDQVDLHEIGHNIPCPTA